VEISFPLTDLSMILKTVEKAGFIGISIFLTPDINRGCRIIAYKGKENPCYDSGKLAYYCGGALAVLDDDHHFIFGKTPVCEKTATIYQLPVYQRLIKVTKGDPDLIARLTTDPVIFNCDTFESDVASFAKKMTTGKSQGENSTAILYPGPFRILILKDGSIIHRGVPVKISKSFAQLLRKTDAFIFLKENLAETALSAVNFTEAYNKLGARCFLDTSEIESRVNLKNSINLAILDEILQEMKQRLSKLIESNAEYFILTGSDARDKNGCCPSDGVASANRLAEAGVLQVARTNTSADSCPVNIYAFSGEIQLKESKPEFKIKPEFRQKIKDYINREKSWKEQFLIQIVRWGLLLFVAFSLMVMVVGNMIQKNTAGAGFSNLNVVEEFAIPLQDGIVILQFHRANRCEFCNKMERLTREALNIHFADEIQEKKMVFRTINMDQSQYESLRKKYELFTSTLVFIAIQNGQESGWKIFTDAWNLTNDEEKFIQTFQYQLSEFIKSVK
jgi:hypothetical protein